MHEHYTSPIVVQDKSLAQMYLHVHPLNVLDNDQLPTAYIVDLRIMSLIHNYHSIEQKS
jgi:hypothetical protein